MPIPLKSSSVLLSLIILVNVYISYRWLQSHYDRTVIGGCTEQCSRKELGRDAWSFHGGTHDKETELMNDIGNSTLGFEKILVVNLPRRTDRKDAMILAAASTKIHLSWIDGLVGSEVADITVPLNEGRKPPGEASKGSWRAHLNVIQAVVERDLCSALVLEDDLDWDVRLKEQMKDFARSVRTLIQPLESSETDTSSFYADPSFPNPKAGFRKTEIQFENQFATITPKLSPYGDNWDVLWLGHCGMGIPDERPVGDSHAKGLIVRTPDETVPKKELLFPQASYSWLPSHYPSNTRLYHHVFIPTCSFAYAVSQRGARKILYELSINKYTSEYDNMLRELCDGERGKEAKLTCITTQPALFTHWRPRGARKKESDITVNGDEWRENGESRDIRWSVRLNMERWARGEEDGWMDQYPD